jgi:hypothetical protein
VSSNFCLLSVVVFKLNRFFSMLFELFLINTLFTRNVFVSSAFDLKFVIAYSKLGKCSSYCWILTPKCYL